MTGPEAEISVGSVRVEWSPALRASSSTLQTRLAASPVHDVHVRLLSGLYTTTELEPFEP